MQIAVGAMLLLTPTEYATSALLASILTACAVFQTGIENMKAAGDAGG